MKLSSKQIGLLRSIAIKPVIAPWSSVDLVKLERAGLVSSEVAYGADGKVHSSKIWELTTEGRRYVPESARA